MKIFVAFSALVAATIAYAADETYGPFNLDGGHITCKSFSGDEIKKSQVYRAPNDRFFREGKISVTEHSGWAPKKHGCELQSLEKQNIKAKTDYGEIEVPVIKS